MNEILRYNASITVRIRLFSIIQPASKFLV
jgi:hypothetical protein